MLERPLSAVLISREPDIRGLGKDIVQYLHNIGIPAHSVAACSVFSMTAFGNTFKEISIYTTLNQCPSPNVS